MTDAPTRLPAMIALVLSVATLVLGTAFTAAQRAEQFVDAESLTVVTVLMLWAVGAWAVLAWLWAGFGLIRGWARPEGAVRVFVLATVLLGVAVVNWFPYGVGVGSA